MAAPKLPSDSAIQKVTRAGQRVDLTGMSEVELLELRKAVEQALPTRALRDLNLEREMVFQLLLTQNLQTEAMSDDNTSPSQRAQIATSVANALLALGKMQVEVYSSERLKRVEAILIEVLKTLPEESQAAFMNAYEEALSDRLA